MNNSLIHNGERWNPITRLETGMPVYVREREYASFNRMKKQSRKDFNSLYFHNQIQSLNTRHGFAKSIVSKFKPLNYELPMEGGSILYTISGGKAFITELKMNLGRQQNENRKPAGLYLAERDERTWKANEALKNVTTGHIAINGYCNDIDDAANMMPEFIVRGYKPEAKLSELNISGYSLFYNPSHGFIKSDMQQVFDSTGPGTETAKKLMALIETHAKTGQELKWTVHEKGHAVFKKALQLLYSSGRVTTAVNRNMGKQQVFYANSTMNLSVVDYHRKRVGMKLAPQPPLINNVSLTQTWGTLNFVSETHVSLTQLREQGEDNTYSRTRGHVASNLLGRAGVLTIGSYALPEVISLGAAGWVATVAGVVVSNKPGSSKKVIENTADVMNDMFSYVK